MTNKTDLKILVAEDNEVNQKVLRIILDKNGYTYEIVPDGIEALNKYKSGIYNLILMDCQMPQLDGLQTSKQIRMDENLQKKERCTIVAMTANAMKGDKEKCLEAGMDDFISKPFKSQDLLQVLQRWSKAKELL